MTAGKRSEPIDGAGCVAYSTYPELLAWILKPDGEDPAQAERLGQRLAELRREVLVRPVIFVGAGTCGLGAGAQDTIDAIRAYLDRHELKADLVRVGCLGLCSAEPLVDVQLPGRARVVFQQVTREKVDGLLDAVLAGQIPEKMVLAQHRPAAGSEPWAEVPMLDEHAFFAPHTRWVLANCGIIDPAEIDEYIARGGYQAQARTLREHSPERVCDMVEFCRPLGIRHGNH